MFLSLAVERIKSAFVYIIVRLWLVRWYIVHPLCAPGLLWSKQFYHYIVESWLDGDPEQPTPPQERRYGRNAQEWKHLFNRDIISMPDKWEYPWVSEWRRKGLGVGWQIGSTYQLWVRMPVRLRK